MSLITYKKIANDTQSYIFSLLEGPNHDKSKFMRYLNSLPEYCKYYGFDEKIISKVENGNTLGESSLLLTIPEYIIISGKLGYLMDIKNMGYDLTKSFPKLSGYIYDFQYFKGMHCPLSTLLQLQNGMNQLQRVLDLNIFNTSEENIYNAVQNSLLTMNISTIANNLFFSPYSHDISKMIKDDNFESSLIFLLTRKRNPNELFITNQFFDFILPHFDFINKKDEQFFNILNAFMNNEHHNQGYIFNQLCEKYPEHKKIFSLQFLKLISSYIKDEYKEKEKIIIDSQLIINLLRNPNLDIKNIDLQNFFPTPKMQKLTTDIFDKKQYNNISFLITNTNLYNNNYILEYIAQYPNIPENIRQSLYNDCIIQDYGAIQNKFDYQAFKEKNKNNFYITEGKSGHDALNIKIEQGKIQTIIKPENNIDSELSQNYYKKRL